MDTPTETTGPSDCDLTGPERKLLNAAVTGALLDLRSGDSQLDDPAQGASWGADRQVRAGLLVEFLTGTRQLEGSNPRAIKLRGARITSYLNLEAGTLMCPLLLWDCHIDEPVSLDQATASAIRMPGCHLPALTAIQLRTTGDLALEATTTGQVRLAGAHIGGQLSMNRATLTNPAGERWPPMVSPSASRCSAGTISPRLAKSA